MMANVRAIVETSFYGDVLRFRQYCLENKVEPRGDSTNMYRVPMRDRKGLAKRLILQTAKDNDMPIKRYKRMIYWDAVPDVSQLVKHLHFGWSEDYIRELVDKPAGIYVCLTAYKSRLLLYAVHKWPDGDLMTNLFDPFYEKEAINMDILRQAIAWLVEQKALLGQFICLEER